MFKPTGQHFSVGGKGDAFRQRRTLAYTCNIIILFHYYYCADGGLAVRGVKRSGKPSRSVMRRAGAGGGVIPSRVYSVPLMRAGPPGRIDAAAACERACVCARNSTVLAGPYVTATVGTRPSRERRAVIDARVCTSSAHLYDPGINIAVLLGIFFFCEMRWRKVTFFTTGF